LTELDLRGNQITNLPESITNLSNLTELDLRGNQITNLPESIAKLSNLKKLYLKENKITDLSESVAKLSNFTELYLSRNSIKKLPESIINLSKLEKLDLSENTLETPPLEVAEKGIEAIRDYFQQVKQDSDYLYLEQDGRDYISLEEYLQICQANGFTERKYKLQLSSYLHDLGVCLHFQDDLLLNKTVILKPEWGTTAVYKVLDNQTVRRNWGKFTKQDLANIWQEQQYENARDELLQLMIKFKLCYKIPNRDIYIAPQLLTENQPTYNWQETNNLILRYTYEFMPKGIITQFIVAMHQHIWQQEYVWKSGVIIEKDQTKAEVIEYYGKREIKIRVVGKHKRDLLIAVTHELDKIHDSYNRLKYNKLIPCNCQKCKNNQDSYFYPLKELQDFVAAGEYTIQCRKSFKMVNVLSLIDDTIDLRQSFEDREREKKVINFKVNIDQNKGMNIDNIGRDFKPIGSPIISDNGKISGTIAETIYQSPNTESEDIQQLLNRLEEAINSSPDLDEKLKATALNQVEALTTAAITPQNEETKQKAQLATIILQGIIANLPPAAAFVTVVKEVIPPIKNYLGIG